MNQISGILTSRLIINHQHNSDSHQQPERRIAVIHHRPSLSPSLSISADGDCESNTRDLLAAIRRTNYIFFLSQRRLEQLVQTELGGSARPAKILRYFEMSFPMAMWMAVLLLWRAPRTCNSFVFSKLPKVELNHVTTTTPCLSWQHRRRAHPFLTASSSSTTSAKDAETSGNTLNFYTMENGMCPYAGKKLEASFKVIFLACSSGP